MEPRHRLSLRKKLIFAVLTVMVSLCLLEGIASLAWLGVDYAEYRRQLPKTVSFQEDFHCRHDPELGWVHLPGKQIPDFYGPGRTITINHDGFRGLKDVVGVKPEGVFRAVCLGDSFTLGYGVDDSATYPAQLERQRPGLQTVNMGQGGYSIGQCYLWYQKSGQALDADCLILACILDDVWRMPGRRNANGYAKPVFELRDGRLVVTGQPVPEKIPTGQPLSSDGQFAAFLTQHNSLARTISAITPLRRSDASPDKAMDLLQIALAIISELKQQTQRQQIPLVLVLLPELHEIESPESTKYYASVSTLFRNFSHQNEILYFDLLPVLTRQGVAQARPYYLDEKWHHLSEQGNRLVAEAIDQFLAGKVPGYPQSESR